MASTQKNNTLKLILKIAVLYSLEKKCFDVMNNFNISKSALYKIWNVKFTLIETAIVENINLTCVH